MKALESNAAGWRQALPACLAMLAAILLLYRDTAIAMVDIWSRSETFAHAYVVPPISLWLIWRQRSLLACLAPRPAPVFLLPIMLMALLWLLGDLAAVNSATQLAMTALLVLVVPATLGWTVTRAIAFPLGFIFFAVPIGEFMMPQLMIWTADFTTMALRLSGIPVYRDGLQFIIPSGNWSVVEACSGIRYMMASLMVGTLFAYLNFRRVSKRWLFVIFAFLLALVGNWMRAYLTVLLGHLSGNQLATGVDHLIYGWVFFGVLMLAMFMIGSRWADPELAPAMPRPESPESASMQRWPLMLAIAVALVAPHLLVSATQAHGQLSGLMLQVPDLSSTGWRPSQAVMKNWQPGLENPRAQLQTGYSRPDGAAIGLHLGYYRQQDYQSKLISSNNVLIRSDDKEWTAAAGSNMPLLLAGQAQSWRSTWLRPKRSGGIGLDPEQEGLQVWQIYWVNGRMLSSDWQAKLFGALYRLVGRGDDAAVIYVFADKSAGKVDGLLADFLRDSWTLIDTSLQRTRESGQASK